MNSRFSLFLAAVGAGGMLLTGCASGDESGTASYSRAGEGAAAPPVAAEGGAPGAPGAAPGAAGADKGGPAQGNPITLQPGAERDIIYTADLRVRTDDVERAATEAKKRVADAGGHVAEEDSDSEPGVPAHVTITFKVPADRYKATLDHLATRLGTRLSLEQRVEDVTAQVADVDSRVKSAEEALASYRRLLAKADTIDEILAVEREISQRESDLESLQARQRVLGEQTAYATVTLRLGSTSADRSTPRGGGFVNGLKSGWDAFLGFLNTAATVFGWLLPFLVAAAIVALPARWLWRVVRRRTAGRRRAGVVRPPVPPGPGPYAGTPPRGTPASGGASPDEALGYEPVTRSGAEPASAKLFETGSAATDPASTASTGSASTGSASTGARSGETDPAATDSDGTDRDGTEPGDNR